MPQELLGAGYGEKYRRRGSDEPIWAACGAEFTTHSSAFWRSKARALLSPILSGTCAGANHSCFCVLLRILYR